MRDFRNKNILVTGGAAGIGKIMCRIFLEKGGKIIIWDNNPAHIEMAVKALSLYGAVSAYCVDVGNPEAIKTAFDAVMQAHHRIDILVNNAGIVVGKYFHQHTPEDIQRTLSINVHAPMYITRLFLPGMMAANEGYICNIASLAGLISNPRMSVYAASKWAVTGWSDSVRLEMKQLQNNIGVTTVMPYYISTGMFDGVQSVIPLLHPEKVARKIVHGIQKGQPIVSMPLSFHIVRLVQGILPIWLFDWLVGGVLGIYKSMDRFRGH